MPEAPKSQNLLVVLTWIIVTLPTAWGLSYTIKNALKLFHPQPAVTSPGPSASH